MGFLLNILVIVGALFLGIVFLLELGRRIRLARMEREGDVGKGVGAEEGAVYGLLGLLIAFTFRTVATQIHPPSVVYVLLMGLALVSALLAGFSMPESRSHNGLHTLLYAAILSLAIYVILDLRNSSADAKARASQSADRISRSNAACIDSSSSTM